VPQRVPHVAEVDPDGGPTWLDPKVPGVPGMCQRVVRLERWEVSIVNFPVAAGTECRGGCLIPGVWMA